MFVDIKRWVLLYLYAGSGSFGHMPYLDSHGEYDISMRCVSVLPVETPLMTDGAIGRCCMKGGGKS
jgi:hypothetical protein